MGLPTEISDSLAQSTIESYRYDAFISYRHVEPDRRWAKWLHSALETYRVPKKLIQQGIAARVGRVFRDEEELSASADLHKDIEAKLRESRYLIVICSPRTPGSRWVNTEVQRFREMGRHDQIFALLIEGEPGESFPPALREIRRTLADEQGSAREQIEEIEPLAADVRPSRSESIAHLSRMAKLRLLACLLGCRFDDLRQREQERKIRRIQFAGVLVTALLCVMTGLTWFAFFQRKAAIVNQRQAVASAEQAAKNEREAEIRLAEGQTAQGDALGMAGRWAEARDVYWQSYASLKRLGLSTFNTEAGLCRANAAAAPPLRSFGNGRGSVVQVVVTPDGRTAVSAIAGVIGVSPDGFSRWDLSTGREIGQFSAPGRVAAVGYGRPSISPNGQLGISQNSDYSLTLWDLLNERPIRTLTGHQVELSGLAFSPDGQSAASIDFDRMLMLWDLPSGSRVRVARTAGRPNEILFGPDDRFAFVRIVGSENSLARWDLTTGELSMVPLPDRSGLGLNAIGLDSATAWLRVGDPSSVVQIDLATGKPVRTILQTSEVGPTAFSADGHRCLAGDRSGAVRYFDTDKGTELAALSGHQGWVRSVAFMPGARAAISGGDDGTLKLWSLRGGRDVRTLEGHTQRVVSVAVSPDGRTVLSGSDDQTLRLWDITTGKVIHSFLGHTGHVHSVAFSSDGRTAFSGCFDGTIRQWDLMSGSVTRTIVGDARLIWGIAVTPDARIVAAAVARAPSGIVDVAAGKEISGENNPDHGGIAVAIAPDGYTALFVGGRWMNFWDLRTPKLFRQIDNGGGAKSVAFTPDGTTALVAFHDGIRQWDAKSGNQLRTLPSSGSLESVAVSPDGQFAVAGSRDKTVKLFDRETGREIRSLAGHSGTVWSVAFGPDGRTLVSGSEDKAVRIWDIGRVAQYPEFQRRLAEAEATLKDHPDDAASLAAIGEWYAFRGVHEWAVELLEHARAGGAAVSPLMLARSYWELSGDLPEGSKLKREDCLAGARREFAKALEASRDEPEKFYLQLCVGAVERETALPATQPATIPTTRPAE